MNTCTCEPRQLPGCAICREIETGYDDLYMLKGAYYAHLSGYDGAEDAGFQPVGHGATRQEAIDDLNEIIEGHAS